MNRHKTLEVRLHGKTVGTLAEVEQGKEAHKIAFEYAGDWLQNGFSISPFSLPLRPGVFLPKNWNFGGLHGAFGDVLPDSWGQLLVDRMLSDRGIDPTRLGILDRLSIVGTSGMGALTFHPAETFSATVSDPDYDRLAELCARLLRSQPVDDLDTLYQLGGSSGGTRPKVLATVNGEDWIIKFQSHADPADFGKLEFDYAACAEQCGIHMAEYSLFPSETCSGYFGMKRFDRIASEEGGRRVHMLSAAALLELDHNAPSMDYHDLMKLTRLLTREDKQDLQEMFRRMCFNVYAHNRDDHSKNVSFLYDEEQKRWHLSPAYDLTYSTTYYGEHTTSVNGNGASPSMGDLLAVGTKSGLPSKWCSETASAVQTTVQSSLKKYLP